MAKAVKPKKEETVEQPENSVAETKEEVTEEVVTEEPVVEEKKEEDTSLSIHATDEKETEVGFLQRLLSIQHEGGWGHHLDSIINDRIKSL